MMERKQRLMGEILEFRERSCQQIRVLDDKISAEELDLLEKKKQAMEELLKERRITLVKEWRDIVVAGCGVTQMAAAEFRTYETDGDLLLSEVGVLETIRRKIRDPLAKSRRRRKEEQ